MIYDQTLLFREAKRYGFVRDTYEKMLRLIEVLHFINHNDYLYERLALKGGTAINLLFFDLPRLSVDIDLDYTINNSREEMLKDRNTISEIIADYMEKDGYVLFDSRRKSYSLDQFIFRYQSSGGAQDNLKIEINYSLREHILTINPYEKIIEKINEEIIIKSVHPIEIFAAKINALLTRGAVRDLYDVYKLVSGAYFDDEERNILKELIVFYKIITNDPSTPFSTTGIESIDKRKMRSDLQSVISSFDPFNLENAKKDVINYLSMLGIFDYNPNVFVSKLKNGTFNANDIFKGKEFAKKGNQHPMIIWRKNTFGNL